METATTSFSEVKHSNNRVMDVISDIGPILGKHVDEEEKNGRLSSEVV